MIVIRDVGPLDEKRERKDGPQNNKDGERVAGHIGR